MKKITWLVVLILVVNGGFLVRALPGQGTSPPDIEFSEELWDFGTIKRGNVVTHIFEVKNTGESPLVISNVRTSCGCMAVLVSSREIAPDSSSQIKVSFNSLGYEGKITKCIWVESNDPDEPRKILTIKANVEVPQKRYITEPKAELTISPIFLNLGTTKQGEKCTAIIELKNRGEKKIKIVNINSSSKLMTVAPSSIEIGSAEEAKINITLNSGEETGQIEEYLYITIALPIEVVIKER